MAGTPGFEGRSPLKSWLYTIATNACVKMMERQPITMPPQSTWYRGRHAIASFRRAVPPPFEPGLVATYEARSAVTGQLDRWIVSVPRIYAYENATRSFRGALDGPHS
jgi:DNA-directed RNA polymerase specialized sigma24 family protein